jgi:hypothetical protein
VSATSEAGPSSGRPKSVVDQAGVAGATDTNPFPGPRPFAESDNLLFFGRDRELSDLVALLFAQRVVLLHAPSGAGKSSLANAGLIPRARQRGFEFLPVARVRGTGPSGGDSAANRYVNNVIENWRAEGMDVGARAADLPEVLRGLPEVDEPGRVVVFDQFEELFVVHPDRWRDRGDLFSQIQEALDRDPLLHFLFVLRDDYLAWLEPLTPLLRDRLSSRYHLGGLNSSQALDAVVKPFEASGRMFAPGVAEDFVKALREQPAELGANRSYEGENVEPVQLQIVCRTFFERLPRDVTEIGAPDVARHADVQQALVGFYEQAIAAVVKGHAGVRERSVRSWFERQLITSARTRSIVFQGERTTAGLANQVVYELERRRLVRSEPRGPAQWYELTHDRLIDAVLESNHAWSTKRSRSITRRALAAGVACVLLAAVVSFVAIHSRHGGSAASASEPKRSQISAPGRTADFPVHGRAGQVVTAIMKPDQGLLGELRLFDGGGLAVGSPSSPESSLPLLTLTLPADGDYRVEALGRGDTFGSFDLSLTVQNVGARAELAGPDPIPGSITAPDQVDVYIFNGRAGALAEITLVDDFSQHLVLIGPGGQGFPELSLGYGVIAAILPQDGSYGLHVWSSDKKGGPYLLRLQQGAGINVQPGKVSGTLDRNNPVDVRTVQTEAGGALTVSYPHPTRVPGSVLLLAANGNSLQNDGGEGGFSSAIAPATTYILVVYAGDFSNGNSYSLSVEIQEPNPLTGGRAQGQLRRDGGIEVYGLDPGQGDVATILVRPAGKFDPRVAVVQPDGTPLITKDNGGPTKDSGGPGEDELFTAQLQQRGPHLIVIDSNSSSHNTGAFSVTVTQHNASAPPP